MKYLYSFLLIILFFSFSCKREKTTVEVSEKSDSLKISTQRIVSTISETLIPSAKKATLEWKEYQDVDKFILKYYNISSSEALDNAEELSKLIQYMKDTIRIEKLKQQNMIARFNVLHNEALRLLDMSTIPSITQNEVKEEVLKIVEIYSAVNSKINTIYDVDELQNSLEVDTEKPIEIKETSIRRKKVRAKKPPNRRLKETIIPSKKIKKQ